MNKRKTYSIPLVIVCVLLAINLPAQDRTTVSVKADRTKILIGEPIQLTLQADIPQNQPIRFFSLDSLPHFEYLQKDKIDTVNTSGGTVLSQLVSITSFDSGHWVIPPFTWHDDVVTDSIPVDVSFTPFDTTQPYHDIKDIIGVEPSTKKKKPDWWNYVFGGALLVLIILYLASRKKKKPAPQVTVPPPDAYKVAMEALAKLQQQQAGGKEYYSRLVDIFRNYVLAKKGILSLQKTTDDLVVQLRTIPLPKDLYDRLSQCLRLSDFVKFAKYEPTATDDQESFATIKSAIDQLEQTQS